MQKGYNPERWSEGPESKGLAPILIILLIAVLGIGGYFIYTSLRGILSPSKEDVTISPTSTPIVSSTPTSSAASPVQSGIGETANWKTYTNTSMSFSIKYPPEWKIVIEMPTHVVLGYEAAGPSFFTEVYQNPNKLSVKDWFLEHNSESGIDFTFTDVNVGGHGGLNASGGIGPYVILKVPNQESVILLGGESFEFNQILSTFKFTQ